MKIEIEDIIFGSLAVISIAIWFFSLIIFDYPLISIIFLWLSMILISLLYIIVYKKKKRDIRILRIRFFVSGLPIYPMMIYYIYKLIFDDGLPKDQEFLPLFVLLPALFLNGIILYFYELR
jgi:hypothetical protein